LSKVLLLHRCRWLHDQAYQFDSRCYSSAAEHGHLDVVIWLHDTVRLRERWVYTAGNAIHRGQYEILLQLLKYGFTWAYNHRDVHLLAAQGGSVQILELLRERMQPAVWNSAQLTEMLLVAGA
jgi:hypothetical protein